jgi:exopolysaccharide biosynthesis WecB/TagA/CpsF family protein
VTKTTTLVPTADILGVRFARLTLDEAIDLAETLYERDEPAWIAVENAHALNLAFKDPSHRDVLNQADLVLNDGKGLLLAARILGGAFPEDLNGNVVNPRLLERASSRGWPVFFLGAAPGVAERAAARLTTEVPGLQVVGTHDGFFGPRDASRVIDSIKSAGARLLVVGMGMPMQEKWLHDHLESTGVALGITAGAFFDFEVGEVKRAPTWMNKIGLEWLFRLMVEPRRLWRRYLIGNPLFVYRIIRQWLSRRT